MTIDVFVVGHRLEIVVNAFRTLIVACSMVLAFGAMAAPTASAARTAPAAPAAVTAPAAKPVNVTRQCNITRISDGHVVRQVRADGVGRNKREAELNADRNVPVPAGHYKRHCRTVRTW